MDFEIYQNILHRVLGLYKKNTPVFSLFFQKQEDNCVLRCPSAAIPAGRWRRRWFRAARLTVQLELKRLQESVPVYVLRERTPFVVPMARPIIMTV